VENRHGVLIVNKRNMQLTVANQLTADGVMSVADQFDNPELFAVTPFSIMHDGAVRTYETLWEFSDATGLICGDDRA
jgi:hypothetical protein